MYIPAEFRMSDTQAMIAFMQQHSFAVLVSSVAGAAPGATHLPFHVKVMGSDVWLTAHMARANPHAKLLQAQPALVIFQGPHAYISPRHYNKTESVPTWNYLAVHAQGEAQIITDEQTGMQILEEMILQSEPEYIQQWNNLPAHYKTGMYKGIVPFQIKVTHLEGKQKLSQNKTTEERTRIIDSLANSPYPTENELAQFMKKTQEEK
jgi:transcriptional regulator